MIMEKKLCYIRVMACSNLRTHIQLTLSAETDDIRTLIVDALNKLDQYNTRCESYRIEHIESFQGPET